MSKHGGRSAVRVIRLEAFAPQRVATQPAPVPAQSPPPPPDPMWGSLPFVPWPNPIGSASVHAAAPRPVQVATVTAPRSKQMPYGAVTSWPVRFQGVGNDYAGLWMRNLLLTLMSLGLYLPWARVLNQRYLMRQTTVAGHVLDYHEPASYVSRRYALAACLVAGVAGAWAGSTMAGMLASSLALSVWPLLVFMSLNHHVAHISWAHRRLALDGPFQDVYRAMWLPLASGGALAWLLMAASIVHRPGAWMLWGVILGLWLMAMPLFVWTWFRFRQGHLRLGPLRLRWRAESDEVVVLFGRTLAWTMLTTLFSMGMAAMAVAAVLVIRGRLSLNVQHVLLLAVCAVVGTAVQPYLQAHLFNLVWDKTGNQYMRIRSKLSVAAFVKLQCRHALLMVFTAGLYWPWAVISSRRMRAQALTIWLRVDADVLKDNWPTHTASQTGKMAGSPAQSPR